MSFFGFDTALPRDKPSGGQTRGIFETSDPFAQQGSLDEDEILDFEDTYDGLGDQLDDADDTFNEDTFGGGEEDSAGKDFDFFGKTAQVADVMDEEHELYNLKHGFKKPLTASLSLQQSKKPDGTGASTGAGKSAAAKPKRTGYEPYQDPGYIPELQAKSSVWGITSKKKEEEAPPPAQFAQPAKKMMSLEEVEAQMRMQTGPQPKAPSLEEIEAQMHAQARVQQHQPATIAPSLTPQQQHPPMLPPTTTHPSTQPPLLPLNIPPQQLIPLLQNVQHNPGLAQYLRDSGVSPQVLAAAVGLPTDVNSLEQAHMAQMLRGSPVAAPPNIPRPHFPHPELAAAAAAGMLPPGLGRPPPGPAHGVYPPTGPGQFPPGVPPPHPAAFRQGHPKPPMVNAGLGIAPVSMPPALANLTDEQRQDILQEEAKRAKRNHKIFLLSKGNGLMTPQDKNFITRIQLQQLVAANGGTENDLETMLAEDFYYQVYSQIRAPRSHPRQPLGHFAQTYLFQTGGRAGNRRQYGGGDNHMQRMQQQVQRAVEAAKARPRNKQLIIEGSLGKISFSNSRTPKTMLNIKRDTQQGADAAKLPRPKAALSVSDRKSILRNIETVYNILMQMEDLQRNMPPSPASEEESVNFDAETHMSARTKMSGLNRRLWDALQVLEPIVPGSNNTHPFIAFLNHSKGKKAIPRIWRYIDQEQRVTILTMIVINLDSLDVVHKGQPQSGETQPVTSVREEIELFQRVVIPSLISYANDAPLNIIAGLFGLVLARTHVESVVMSRIGLLILCMLLSRAETIRGSTQIPEAEWAQWMELYNQLFDRLEHAWDAIFPESINSGDDMYAWQFLAAVGVGANPEQQQRLVIAVKDRVIETVQQSKTLPPDMGAKRLANVNLFMRSIGLDVELL